MAYTGEQHLVLFLEIMFVVASPAVGGNSLQVRGRESDILFSDPTNNKIYKYIIQYDMLEVFVAG